MKDDKTQYFLRFSEITQAYEWKLLGITGSCFLASRKLISLKINPKKIRKRVFTQYTKKTTFEFISNFEKGPNHTCTLRGTNTYRVSAPNN